MKKRRIPLMSMFMMAMLVIILFLSIGYKVGHHKNKVKQEYNVVEIPEIKYENIKNNNGIYSYEDSNFSSSFGIDVSEFQDEIDWQKVSKTEVEFAFLRLGRRSATTGLLYFDDNFEKNYQGAKENNISVGVYFFSQTINELEAKAEAHFVINALKTKEIELPVVLDLENVILPAGVERIDGLTKEQFTKNTLAFCEEIENAGYQPMIYTFPYWSEENYDMEQLENYPIWYAHYDVEKPDVDFPISMWQYSRTGSIDGINGDVDLNIMFTAK